jgi:L-asparaginase
VEERYFWTRKRWEEHRAGLGKGKGEEEEGEYERARAAVGEECDGALYEDVEGLDDPSWNGSDYLPQGTVGCVVLDREGTLCVATSTGGITNKLPGRVGDTPTLGAGFWAEDWAVPPPNAGLVTLSPSPLSSFTSLLTSCLPSLATYLPIPQDDATAHYRSSRRATAISGTGNGDSFLRLAAVRTASAIARFSPHTSLQTAVTAVAGPHGMLEQSAGDRWLKSGEGEGGMIGIELGEDGQGRVVADFNCGGMFRAWIDDSGEERAMVFRGEY